LIRTARAPHHCPLASVTGALLLVGLVAVGLVAVGPLDLSRPSPASAGTAGFSDVSASHPFYGHITWMEEEGVSTGYADGTFRPGHVVTRGAMAAFLYRVAGSPAFDLPSPPTFPDVPAGHPFFTEVEWLAAEGITVGFPDGTFRPGDATSRGAMAAYLFRSSGSPAFEDPETARFTDVSLTHPYSHDVEWLAAEQVTTGFDDDTFRPASPVTRQSMSAFIFRVQHRAPALEVEGDFVTGLDLPWDVAWAPDGGMLFDDLGGGIYAVPPGADEPTERLTDPQLAGDLADFQAWGESGMTGLVLDPDFAVNRTFYTCQIDTDRGNAPADHDLDDDRGGQVVSWTVDEDYTAVTRVAEVIHLAQWFPVDGGHLGCRLRFGLDGHLWIATGDRRCGTNPQDLSVLAGKVLRVDEDADAEDILLGVPGNPFYGDDDPGTDPTIYTYGHRNPQGLALRPATGQMFSVEHGTVADDEVNLLTPGANFGWDPAGTVACADAVGGQSETDYYLGDSDPMTDLVTHPDAVEALWSSGLPTVATSGAGFLEGDSWGGWEGGLMVATLKGRHARVMFFTEGGALIEERRPPELDQVFGRLRTVQLGPDEDVFLTTSNHNEDRVIRVSATP
jgi:glucose/arabinose dehydrogenase